MAQLVVVGGGPAGIAAALQAYEDGLRDILIVERDKELGGILNQCIHSGFGLNYFKEDFTGPEYAQKFIDMLEGTTIKVKLNSMVIDITPERDVHLVSAENGYEVIPAESVILAMGCRERPRGAIQTPGTRPAGIFTAGTAQRYINMEGYMVGREVVILGSGDIGLIMARRMSLEGAKVLACIEIMPHSNGLGRNIAQCLNDFDIPLYLSHTITDIKGKKRVEGITVSKVDDRLQPIPGTSFDISCDTILLSVGLLPENELSKQAGVQLDPRTKGAFVYDNMETNIPGVFACGNVLHVHDLVDFVTTESQRAGSAAAKFALNQVESAEKTFETKNGNDVTYTVPQTIRMTKEMKKAEIFFRVRNKARNVRIMVESDGKPIAKFKRASIAPAEMEHIVIPRILLDKAEGSDISVRVEKEEA